VRTFSASTGAAVNADSTPTITPVGATSGDLSANLGAVSNPATGVYRATYTVASGATQEQVRFDVSATISSSTFTLSCYTQVVDLVSATWTSTDASHLTAVFNKLPANNIADETLVLAAIANVQSDTDDLQSKIGTPAGASLAADVAAVKTDTGNLVSRITATLFAGVTSLAQWLGLIAGKQTGNSTARTELRATGAGSGTFDETTDSVEALRDRGDAAWVTATSVTVSDKTGFKLAADGTDLVLVAGKTLPNALKYIGAAASGTLSGSQTTTEVFKDFSGATALTVTVDSSGNRSSITYG
jgi:hypothetical protein